MGKTARHKKLESAERYDQEITLAWKREIQGMMPETFREEFRGLPEFQHLLLEWATDKQVARLNDYDLDDLLGDPEHRAIAEAKLPMTYSRPR